MAAIDLYSGVGGWTLGFKMAGIPVLASYEWWKDANRTHNKNFGSNHSETDIRTLDLSDLPDRKGIDLVVGSPPCTQFSYANRGGNGDIKDGLIDIKKFLEVVEYIQPKYWAMENVPRVAKILEKELKAEGELARFKHLFGDIRVYNSSDFGVPQDRKRMIAGKLPFALLDAYANTTSRMELKEVLDAMSNAPFTDPIYGLKLDGNSLTDHVLEPNLSLEEARINQESKLHHPVYNRMSFPDRQDRPSRTITALCTRVSRESIIIKDSKNNLRRLTVRERACIQSFPINYQFFGTTYANKIKMIGNAVPPLLTFYIAQSMLETKPADLLKPKELEKSRLELSKKHALSHEPDNEGANYPWNRSFWLAIKGLRLGSGVRFELKNRHDKENKTTKWRINFFYGNSKAIKQKVLDQDILERALQITKLEANISFHEQFNGLTAFIKTVNEKSLQKNWSNIDRTQMSPIYLVDELARHATSLKHLLMEKWEIYSKSINAFIKKEFPDDKKNKSDLRKKSKPNKLEVNGIDIFIGILIGSCFNSMMERKVIKLKKAPDIKKVKVKARA